MNNKENNLISKEFQSFFKYNIIGEIDLIKPKLRTPNIYLYEFKKLKLDAPIIRLEEARPSSSAVLGIGSLGYMILGKDNTSSVLGEAIIGEMILGKGGEISVKLQTPQIKLLKLEKLKAPNIYLEKPVALETPSIELFEEILGKLETPSIYLE